MKKAFILHGWYQNISDNWYPWLKRELEAREYQVFLPFLNTSNTDLPDLEQMLNQLEERVY